MKNKFNLKNIIKKIKSNKAEETINTVLIVVAGLVLVALFIGIVINGGKNTINETGGMIDNILNTVDTDDSNTTEEESNRELNEQTIRQCNTYKIRLEEWNNVLHSCQIEEVCDFGIFCYLKDICRGTVNSRYVEIERAQVNDEIRRLEQEISNLGCPL